MPMEEGSLVADRHLPWLLMPLLMPLLDLQIHNLAELNCSPDPPLITRNLQTWRAPRCS